MARTAAARRRQTLFRCKKSIFAIVSEDRPKGNFFGKKVGKKKSARPIPGRTERAESAAERAATVIF
jgi:hypothetical protein